MQGTWCFNASLTRLSRRTSEWVFKLFPPVLYHIRIYFPVGEIIVIFAFQSQSMKFCTMQILCTCT